MIYNNIVNKEKEIKIMTTNKKTHYYISIERAHSQTPDFTEITHKHFDIILKDVEKGIIERAINKYEEKGEQNGFYFTYVEYIVDSLTLTLMTMTRKESR